MIKSNSEINQKFVRKTFYLPADLSAWLDAKAKCDSRSASKYLAILLSNKRDADGV